MELKLTEKQKEILGGNGKINSPPLDGQHIMNNQVQYCISISNAWIMIKIEGVNVLWNKREGRSYEHGDIY